MRCERSGEVALLRLEGGKANAMDDTFLDALDGLLGELEAGDARAAVITGSGQSFSAGLNLATLSPLPREAIGTFIAKFHRVMFRVFRLAMPVVAAVNGHAIAGGCVLALQADHRIAADGPFKIGLNEAQIGLGLPPVVIESARLRLPASSWNAVMLEGRLFTPAEALEQQLVDQVVAPDRVEAVALDVAGRLAALPAAAYAQIKSAIRAPAIAALSADVGPAHEAWLDTWFSPDAIRIRGEALARLSKRG